MMLSENIKKHRNKNNMSQEELAQRLNVSRQSVSLWETGQSQPTIDNIIALAKIFGISSDELLGNFVATKESIAPKTEFAKNDKKSKLLLSGKIIVIAAILIMVLTVAIFAFPGRGKENPKDTPSSYADQENSKDNPSSPTDQEDIPAQVNAKLDLFGLCKDFAIQNGNLNGDYCIYQQPSTLYGGYDNEYFSISYWGDSDMVEFCLHCPLDDTLSVNFYLRMRGGYDGKYEYLSSKYYRSDGSSIRSASGYIDPAVFTDKYPLSCDSYNGSFDGQDEFMEESRVGICDLIKCLKQFVTVEDMKCSFSDFEFTNF